MKKSIALVLLLYGMINAEQGEFYQMFAAIEESDYSWVKDLMERYQFQRDPELMNRFLIYAREVVVDRNRSLTYRDEHAIAAGACVGAGVYLMSKIPWALLYYLIGASTLKESGYESLPGLAGGLLGCLGVYHMKNSMNEQPRRKIVLDSENLVVEQSNSLSRRDKLLFACGGLGAMWLSSLNPCTMHYKNDKGYHFDVDFPPQLAILTGGTIAGLLAVYLGSKALSAKPAEMIVSYLEAEVGDASAEPTRP